jgi:hypothetical protein
VTGVKWILRSPSPVDDDAFLVDVHPDPSDTIVHDRLLPYVALAGLRQADPRYMRWGRSLHNVYGLELMARLPKSLGARSLA